MCGKAAGLDGCPAKMFASLPRPALHRLAQLLDLFEEKGHWPKSLKQWKLIFLPKSKVGKIPGLADVRPICIAPVLYRIWGRIRLQQLRTLLTQTLAPYQSGGVGGPDVVSLLLSYDLEFPVENFRCVAALDFAKAFDSCDTSLVISIFSKIGVPDKIVRLLADQWNQHNKWVTFASSVCPQPLSHTRGLPQGDPWSPIGMSLVLMLAKQRADRLVPEARSLLYLDDRTILAPNPTILRHALDAWDDLYRLTRLKNNPNKQQFLARCPTVFHSMGSEGFPATPTIEVLGVTLGSGPRKKSQAEVQRATKVKRICKRLSVLPVSQTFKSSLAATVVAPLAVWGALLNGRVPTKDENAKFLSAVLSAVRNTTFFHSGGGSTSLRQCLLLGHSSDLRFLAAQRLLMALQKWRSSRDVEEHTYAICFEEVYAEFGLHYGPLWLLVAQPGDLGYCSFSGICWSVSSLFPSTLAGQQNQCMVVFWEERCSSCSRTRSSAYDNLDWFSSSICQTAECLGTGCGLWWITFRHAGAPILSTFALSVLSPGCLSWYYAYSVVLPVLGSPSCLCTTSKSFPG